MNRITNILTWCVLLASTVTAATDISLNDLAGNITAPFLVATGSYELLGLLVLVALAAIAFYARLNLPTIAVGATLVIGLMAWWGFINQVVVIALLIVGALMAAVGLIRLIGGNS